jgi:hypothetical protein
MSFKPVIYFLFFLLLSQPSFNQESTHINTLIKEYENEVRNNNTESAGLVAYEIAIQHSNFKEYKKAIDYFKKMK